MSHVLAHTRHDTRDSREVGGFEISTRCDSGSGWGGTGRRRENLMGLDLPCGRGRRSRTSPTARVLKYVSSDVIPERYQSDSAPPNV